mmetsp:Transcript_19744/g.29975  ORF Transcript_19744/g.29975 Transcript_19744/m.29975 type:complete len:311 (+) Transcript_19744:3-935(+)
MALRVRFGGWRRVSCEGMNVRSLGYLQHKKKIQAPGDLYDCAQCDIFEGPVRYPDMALRVRLPPTNFDDGPDFVKTWRCPDTFIVSIAIPTEIPKLGKATNDGPGYTITFYFTMRQEMRDILKRVTAPGYNPLTDEQNIDQNTSIVNGVKLFEEWCRRAPTDPKFQSRFKLIPNAHNLKEIGVPGWITRYNAKPILIKRAGETGILYSHPELSCMEFDVSLHPFPYLAKQGIMYLKGKLFKEILVTFGFCIEGRSDEELPEVLIGQAQLCYPDPAIAIQAENFFSSTSPKSFTLDDPKEENEETAQLTEN